jgi:pilus assembly protein Flp/PilA
VLILLNRFITDEHGATAIEYGLIAALIAITIIGGVSALGSNLNSFFNSTATKVSTGFK